MRWKVDQQEKKLDDLFALVEAVQEEEVKAYLSKFLCVRASGFIESSTKNLVYEYIQGTSPQPVQKFLSDKIKTISNLSYYRLIALLKSFNEEWCEEFELSVNDEQRAALNSVISNRNNIAHGEGDSISYELMKSYYKNIKHIVHLLKSIIKK